MNEMKGDNKIEDLKTDDRLHSDYRIPPPANDIGTIDSDL